MLYFDMADVTFQLIASFKDGVWSQTTTPLNVDGVKTQAMTSRIEGGDLVTVRQYFDFNFE